MNGGRRRAGLLGAAAGLTAAGLGLGITVHRYAAARVRGRPTSADADEAARADRLGAAGSGAVCPGRSLVVPADDAVPLHVEVDGNGVSDREPTIVFCHGYALHLSCWHYQRRGLSDLGRMVLWDQRGHGQSGRGDRGTVTVDQLGRDLHAVLRATVPADSPIVLVGHSMGGMTIMALADQHPELFGDQVRGVALICTSAGDLTGLTYGLPGIPARVMRRLTPGLVSALGQQPNLVEPSRRVGRDLGIPLVRYFGFSRYDAEADAVRLVNEMIANTPVDVVAEFFDAVMAHDKTTALDVLSRTDTLIVAGAEDRLAPAQHSRVIAAAVATARLWVLPRAGHLAMLEWPDVVNDALRGLVGRVRHGSMEGRTE